MFKNRKLTMQILIAASAVIVLILTYIQYSLVSNTFNLTKDKHYNEVRMRMNQILNTPKSLALQAQLDENIRRKVASYDAGPIDHQRVLSDLTTENLHLYKKMDAYYSSLLKKDKDFKNVRYVSQYEEIIIVKEGVSDTVLSTKAKPIVLLGKAVTPSTILLNHNELVSVVNRDEAKEPAAADTNLKLIIRSFNGMDVSNWENTIFRQMLGTFVVSTIFIVAVITVFYGILSAMFRQKRIADVKTDFANNITHELKTPLSSVSLILKSMERVDVRQNESLMDDLLTSLKRQYHKIQNIVDSVLESAMVTEGPIERRELDIKLLLENYIADLRLPNHQLKVNMGGDKVVLTTDSYLVEKILDILVENAQKYSPEGSTIILEALAEKDYYVIAIKDEGKGIEPRYQQQIFEKFFRIPENNRHTVKGLGLGLFLAKQASERIGASLILKSKIGDGNSFLLKLPL